ncbi:MAG: hypothetical protein QOI77_2197 [Blastocatellia bacterium]|nr:hypothetical protein [Blastocatellia bacterium]
MGTLNLIERESVLRPMTRQGFWQCQFGSQVTRPQIVFDIAFGIVGPILCFAFDPLVFRGGIGGDPLFADIKIYVYLFSGLEVLILSFWLLARAGFQLWNDLSGAALLVGGVFCLAAGLILLPFSLMGLMFGVGIFGFTPFVTGIVYLRNGIRALRSPRTDTSAFSRVATVLLGSLVAIGAPLLLGVAIHGAVESSVDEIVHGDPSHASAAAHRIGPLRYFVGAESDQIVTAYQQASEPARKQLLRDCYQEITGHDIEVRIRIMND